MRDSSLADYSILFSLCGDSNKASSRVRGFWIADELKKLGSRCTLRWGHSKIDLVKFAFEIPRYDVVIFQKNYSRYHRWLMVYANWLGKRTYIDFDDTPSRINSTVTLNNIESMMRMATGVFVGSNGLLEYAKKYQVKTYLVPSGIKLEDYKLHPKSSELKVVTLGWIGNGPHYKKDLIEILKGPLAELASRYPIKFKLVGACGDRELHETFKSIQGLGVEIIDDIEWSDPDSVAVELASFDIGLYPLLANDFNQYKCGFKALEYMATGIPVVASDITGISDIVSNGEDGLLVKADQDWFTALEKMIRDDVLRQKMGKAGRRKIEGRYSTEKCAESIYSVICDAV